MEPFKTYQPVLIVVIISMSISVYAQISSPCTSAMLTTFTPCFNYITGSTRYATSPAGGCCEVIKSLIENGAMDCYCLLVNANVPAQPPMIRILALALPRVCDMGNVPLQCKAPGSPIPATDPSLLGPTPSSPTDLPSTPRSSKAVATAASPQSEAESPEISPEAPTITAINTPVLLIPSAASSLSFVSAQPLLLIAVGIMAHNLY